MFFCTWIFSLFIWFSLSIEYKKSKRGWRGLRYRYITAKCNPEDQICKFRLVSHKEIGSVAKEVGRTLYRIKIPDDLILEKWSCDHYSTTEDKRTLRELGYDIIMTMWNGERKVIPQNSNIEALDKEQTKKWVNSLYENYELAYHPHPQTDEEKRLKEIENKRIISKIAETNPELAETLKLSLERNKNGSALKSWSPPYNNKKKEYEHER